MTSDEMVRALERIAKLDSDYKLAERENDNLRAALKVALAACPPEVAAQIGAMIAGPVEDGGVVEDGREEDEAGRWELFQAGELLDQVANHLEADGDGLFRIVKGLPKDWPTKAMQIAQREAKSSAFAKAR